jgi:cell division protein FtsQ
VNLRAARRAIRRDVVRGRRRTLRAVGAAAALVVVWAALAAHPWWDDAVAHVAERTQRALGLVVAELEVHGTARVAPATVRAALEVDAGAPILALDLAAARARIEALGWVDRASVRRELPNRVVVTLDEHTPRALWLGEGGPALVAGGGEMLAVPADAAAAELPRLVGAGAPPAVEPILRALTTTPDLLARLERLERVAGRRWRLWLAPGVRVELPAGAPRRGLARLAAQQSAHRLLDRAVAAVDLRLDDRLVVTPAPLVREARG